MDTMKDYLEALKNGKGYEWFINHGLTLNKYELVDIVKRFEHAIWIMTNYYENEEWDGYDIYSRVSKDLECLYLNGKER